MRYWKVLQETDISESVKQMNVSEWLLGKEICFSV